MVHVHQVERFGRLVHVAQQLRPRDARLAAGSTHSLKRSQEVAVGQLHDDERARRR